MAPSCLKIPLSPMLKTSSIMVMLDHCERLNYNNTQGLSPLRLKVFLPCLQGNTNVASFHNHVEPIFEGTYTMTTKNEAGITPVVAATVAAIALVLQSKDVIKADQDVIKSNLTKLDMAIHNNAVQCMLHAEKHGDTSLMRRLLVEVIDTKTGYRRQGLINWMRKFSPMELKGDIINLSGVDLKGEKRPFLVEKANETPFWSDSDNREMVAKPVFRSNLMSKINSSIKEFRAAIANTSNGQPIDTTKPFFDCIYTDEVSAFFDELETKANELQTKKPDKTNEVRKAQNDLAEALAANKVA